MAASLWAGTVRLPVFPPESFQPTSEGEAAAGKAGSALDKDRVGRDSCPFHLSVGGKTP